MRVNRWIVPIIAIFVLLGSVIVAKGTGWWQTTGRNLTTIGDIAPEDIRGSSTLADVSAAFGIPHADLYRILGLPENIPLETRLTELKDIHEVGVIKGLVAEYLGIPWEWDEEHEHEEHEDERKDTEPAASTATEFASSTTEHVGPTSPLPGEVLPGSEIKGRMTLKEVSESCDIPLDVLYRELGLGDDIPPETALRSVGDLVDGFEVGPVRDIVEKHQAK